MAKSVYFFCFLGVIIVLSACNNFRSDHPQSTIDGEYATPLTPQSIINYTDSVDQNLAKYQKEASLVYTLGDLSFHVDRYTENNKPILLVEHSFNGLANASIKQLYFKNDSLILEKINSSVNVEEGAVFKEVRSFLRNNTVFKSEERTASTKAALSSQSFVETDLAKLAKPTPIYDNNIAALHHVVDGTDKFELVFQNITTYPDARYIILKSRIPNSYTASILVKEKDPLIDSLLNDPIIFKDQKLNLTWVVKDNEAIYVPVSGNTSAKGLNK